MPQLDIRETAGNGKVYYHPVVLKVSGVSQYNANQISFEGVPDFWQLPEGLSAPPPGTVARFSLATKPKNSHNAKPGSMYRDIVKVAKASEDEYTGPPAAPAASYVDKETPTASPQASGAQQANHWDVREQQIKLGMAFNNLTTMLASDKFEDFPQADVLDMSALSQQWINWFMEASRGLPLTPVVDQELNSEAEHASTEEVDDLNVPAGPLREGPDDTFEATAQPEKPVEDVLELPW